jgi:hypothetical protein
MNASHPVKRRVTFRTDRACPYIRIDPCNDATVPIRYSLQSVTLELPGSGTGQVPPERYRVSPGQSHRIIIYCDFSSMQEGRAVGVLEYRLWYGTLSNPDLYEQNYRVQFTNTPDVDPKTSSTSYMRLAGGTDERRLPS